MKRLLMATPGTRTAHAYIKEKLFVKWRCEADGVADSPMNTATVDGSTSSPRHSFDISLKRLLDCLDIFGSAGQRATGDSDRLNDRFGAERGPSTDVLLDRGKRARTSMKLAYEGRGSALVLE